MFHRLLVEEWQRVLSIISFAIFGTVFVLNLIRVARLPRRQIDQLANLPFETTDSIDHEARP